MSTDFDCDLSMLENENKLALNGDNEGSIKFTG